MFCRNNKNLLSYEKISNYMGDLRTIYKFDTKFSFIFLLAFIAFNFKTYFTGLRLLTLAVGVCYG